MPVFFRSVAIFVGGAGLLSGGVLIFEAQPTTTLGTVNTTLVVYGVISIVSGFLWALTWWALAEVLQTVRTIAARLEDGEPKPSPDR